jgi:hypothetical protein
VLLSYEHVQPNMKTLLPVNSMRNHALLLAQTPLVAMLDADLVPSANMASGEHCSNAQPRLLQPLQLHVLIGVEPGGHLALIAEKLFAESQLIQAGSGVSASNH